MIIIVTVKSSEGLHLFEQWNCPGNDVILRCPHETKIQVDWGEMRYDPDDHRCRAPGSMGKEIDTKGRQRGVCSSQSQSLGVSGTGWEGKVWRLIRKHAGQRKG